MAYADLYADAAIYYDLNNNKTPVINTTVAPDAAVLDGLAGSGSSWIYYADAPPGSGHTHSLKMNAYSLAPRSSRLAIGQSQTYTNNYGYDSYGETVNFWYKVVTTNTPNNIGAAITIMKRENGTTDERLLISGGGNYVDPSSQTGKLDWANQRFLTGAGAASTHIANSSQFSITPDQWYNVTLTWLTHNIGPSANQKNIERAMYVNGTLIHNSVIESTQGWNALDNLEFFNTNTGTQNVQILSSLALWNRALSPSEIEALAYNNNIITDIQQYNDLVVNTSQAMYYTTFNNPDKNTNTETYGTSAASWGPFNDVSTTIAVNQESKFGKSWLLTTAGSTLSQEADVSGGVAMNTGMQEAVRLGRFSLECWIKVPTSSTQYRRIGSLYPDGGSPTGGRVDYSLNPINNISVPSATVPRWVSGSSYTGLAINPTGLYQATTTTTGRAAFYTPTSADLKLLYKHLATGMADGEWHHYALTYVQGTNVSDQGGRSPYARVYKDGCLLGEVALSTSNSMFTSIYQYILMGHPSSDAAIATDFYIDKWAFYDRRLTINEINKHWTTGKAYINQAQNQVKYWDGTSWATSTAQKVWNGTDWVDWNASYYDGTNWITIE